MKLAESDYLSPHAGGPIDTRWIHRKHRPQAAGDAADRALPHLAVEADQSAFTRRQRIDEVPTKHQRVAFVHFGGEVGIAARLGRRRHILESRRQVVDQHDRLMVWSPRLSKRIVKSTISPGLAIFFEAILIDPQAAANSGSS